MDALGVDPALVGSIAIPRAADLRACPTRLARRRLEPARRVTSPRHLIVYGTAPDGIVEILGLAHDRMLLSRSATRMLQASDD